MNTHIDSPGAPVSLAVTPVVPAGSHLNTQKHGLRSAHVLQPGDDVAEFLRMRREMFELYKPRTGNEDLCVEAMAGHEWVMERCRRMRSHWHGKLDALVSGDPQRAAGVHCERDPHRWLHSAMDCSLEEGRLGRLQDRECRKLAALQKRRRKNLIAGAVEATERERVALDAGMDVQPLAVAPDNTVLPGGDAEPTRIEQREDGVAQPAIPSGGQGNGKNHERIVTPAVDAGGNGPLSLPPSPNPVASPVNGPVGIARGGNPQCRGGDGETRHPALRTSGAILAAALGDPETLARADAPPPGLTQVDQERWWRFKRHPETEAQRRERIRKQLTMLEGLPERDRRNHRDEYEVLLTQT